MAPSPAAPLTVPWGAADEGSMVPSGACCSSPELEFGLSPVLSPASSLSFPLAGGRWERLTGLTRTGLAPFLRSSGCRTNRTPPRRRLWEFENPCLTETPHQRPGWHCLCEKPKQAEPNRCSRRRCDRKRGGGVGGAPGAHHHPGSPCGPGGAPAAPTAGGGREAGGRGGGRCGPPGGDRT